MADVVDVATRRRMMQAVPRENSAPELIVRRLVHRMGFRFRLHVKRLPGSPDLVFPRHRKIIFVHGCFWHRHTCKYATRPSTRKAFWNDKFRKNMTRDRRTVRKLKGDGWSILTIWQCQTVDEKLLQERVLRFLEK